MLIDPAGSVRLDAASAEFVVGWLAERHPELVRRISRAGHEIAGAFLRDLAEEAQGHVVVLRSHPAHVGAAASGAQLMGYGRRAAAGRLVEVDGEERARHPWAPVGESASPRRAVCDSLPGACGRGSSR